MKKKIALLLSAVLLVSLVLPVTAFAGSLVPPKASADVIALGSACTISLGSSGPMYDAKYKSSITDVKLNGVSIPGGENDLWWKHASANSIIIDSYCLQTSGSYTVTIVAANYVDQDVTVKVIDKAAASLSLSKSNYAPGEKIIVSFSGITDQMIADSAFISWYKAGASHSEYNTYKYPKTAAGTFEFVAPAAGNYEMRLYCMDYIYTDITFVKAVPFTVSGAPVAAGSLDNFLAKNKYTRGQFTDVNETQWYGFDQQKVIAHAYEYGLMKGSSDKKFNPSGNMTIAEAITMAARIHSIYMTGSEDFKQGSPWYQVYIDYAVANGLVKAGDFSNYTVAATRAQMAYIFAHALPDSCYEHLLLTKEPPDVASDAQYRKEIFLLYGAGILAGSDDLGTFHPSNNIKRAEVSAIAVRLILPGTRLGHAMSS